MAMKRLSFVFTDFVNSADVGMVERRRSPRLAPEALGRLRICSRAGRKKLKRDKAAQSNVFCLVNDTHATTAQPFYHTIMGDGFADHVSLPEPGHALNLTCEES